MSSSHPAAPEANPRMEPAADAAQGAFTEAAHQACQWVQKYPLHAVAVAFTKGILLGLYLRR
jgi:ElaB/YqjD/DUF883 family membrane-anchored ribosome-binding protein